LVSFELENYLVNYSHVEERGESRNNGERDRIDLWTGDDMRILKRVSAMRSPYRA